MAHAVGLALLRSGCPTLYRDQETHLTVNSHLRALGFALSGWRWHGHLKCEGTGFFTRPDARGPSVG